jgi:hypothetical protein
LHTLGDKIECSLRPAIDVNQSRHNPDTSTAWNQQRGRFNKWQNAAAMQKYAVEANIIALSETDSCLPQLT